jgi:hypothetical protein
MDAARVNNVMRCRAAADRASARRAAIDRAMCAGQIRAAIRLFI